MDPAHASYHYSALAAARSYCARASLAPEVLDAVRISVPAPIGTPLLLTAKTVVDALVTAGIAKDDKCDILRQLTVVRHDPTEFPMTYVWLSEPFDNDNVAFAFPGIPAPPQYLPLNTKPKFKNSPSTPREYRKNLESELWEFQGRSGIPVDPSSGCSLLVWVNPVTPVDLDNVGLRVLDHLELDRGAGDGPLLLDEILREIQIVFTQNCTSETVQFVIFESESVNGT